MALVLFEVGGGFRDQNGVSYLSGTGAPGSTTFTEEASIGSKYVDIAVPITYEKIAAGSGTDKWAVQVSDSAPKLLETINQTAHGFSVGEWLYLTSTGYAKADGSDVTKSDAIGVVESVVDVDNFDIVTSGMSDVSFTSTTGNALFLNQSVVGGATTTKPETGVQKNLGFVRDNKIFVAIDITVDISDDSAPSVPLVVVSDVTTIEVVDSISVDESEGVDWRVVASFGSNKEANYVHAIHNGTSSSDANTVQHSVASTVSIGTITGLALGVSLSGSGLTQELNLTVVSTDSVNVRVRRLSYG